MAIFKPYRVQSSQLDSLPKVEGQFIVVEDTQEMYFDKSTTQRIAVSGLTDVNVSIVNGVLTLTDKDGNTLSTTSVPRVIEAVSWNDETLPDTAAFDTYSKSALDTMFQSIDSDLNDKIDTSEKGANNGVAELDANGKVPSSQLPSYVDDVEDYASLSNFPATGESGKIYIALDTNITYRWNGVDNYVAIGSDLALGETSSTAYRGDRGAAAYAHAVTNKGAAFASGLYKITTNAEGHITAATAVAKSDITELGIPAQDTTYATGNASTAGITKLYTETGQNTDGAMTQKAVTDLIGDITTLMAAL